VVDPAETDGMFARYYVELPIAATDVERALSRDPSSWLPGLAEHANNLGDILLAEVGFGEEIRITRTVSVEIGEPILTGSKTVVPLRWTACPGAGLFPSLDADMEVASLGADRTQLAINARYVPPFGAIGRAMDRALLSRVAEATLKDFLDRVGESLMDARSIAG
jgi:hypothetical protein